MRIYIIGTDGITLCRGTPTAVNEGEIVVASNEELHAARLSGKRLLALWNALPDVEKRKKVGDRGALVDELWSAIERLPEPQYDAKRPSRRLGGWCSAIFGSTSSRRSDLRRSPVAGRDSDSAAAQHTAPGS
jgi:hypothetical protein